MAFLWRTYTARVYSANMLFLYSDLANNIARIMDNIMSNIVKYADSKEPIRIVSTTAPGIIGLMFQNRIISSEEYTESNGIGIHSIKSMMKEMGGECRSDNTETGFWVEIRFPIRQ